MPPLLDTARRAQEGEWLAHWNLATARDRYRSVLEDFKNKAAALEKAKGDLAALQKKEKTLLADRVHEGGIIGNGLRRGDFQFIPVVHKYALLSSLLP